MRVRDGITGDFENETVDGLSMDLHIDFLKRLYSAFDIDEKFE